MKVNYENNKHYVPFYSLNVGDVFCTEFDGEVRAWVKQETWDKNCDNATANAFCLDVDGDYHWFERTDEVILPKRVSLNIEL